MNENADAEKKLAKNTAILSICTLLNKGLMFIMVPFFTRWISVEDYGTYDVFTTYVLLLIPLITFASSNAIFRLSVNADAKKQKEYIKSGLIFYLINYILSVFLILLISYIFKLSLIVPFIVLLTAELFDNYFQGFLRAIKKLSLYGICKSLTVVFTAITVTVLVRFMNLGLQGLIYGYSLGYFISSIVIVFITKFWNYIYKVKFSFTRVKELISYSWPLIPNDISWWVINVSDRQIINMFLGATSNGIYAVAYKLPNLCSSVFGVFNVSWQESATDTVNDKNSKEYYEKILNSTMEILLSLCIGIVACNFLFFDYIFDPRYTSARLYTPFLVASVIFGTLSLFYGGIQISLKRPKANGLSTILGAIANICTHLLFIKVIGLYAAAISTLVSNAVVYFVRKILLKDKYIFTINKVQYFYILIFIYFSIMGMMCLPLVVNLIDLLIASLLFIYINRIMVISVLRKVKKRIIK